jgi:hypothetical protein
MPHWNGAPDFETPPHLVPLRDKSAKEIEADIEQTARRFKAEVLAISWEPGKYDRRAHVTVRDLDGSEGGRRTLEYYAAKGIRALKSSDEKDAEADPTEDLSSQAS